MPIIQLTTDEELKVYDKLRKAGPITAFYPGDILIVQDSHLKVLDEAGIQYTKKNRDAIRQSRLEWKKHKKQNSISSIS